MVSEKHCIREFNQLAKRILRAGHPERDIINKNYEEVLKAWNRLQQFIILRREKN